MEGISPPCIFTTTLLPTIMKQNARDTIQSKISDFDPSNGYLQRDPVHFVWEYKTQQNRELVGIIASSLAYGQMKVFTESIEEVLDVLGDNPARKIDQEFGSVEESLQGFSYRMTEGNDLLDLIHSVKETFDQEGTLEALYRQFSGGTHLQKASSLVSTLRKRRRRDDLGRGFSYLIPDPDDGSACKRLNLFFRWMVRGPDSVDLGEWDESSESELIVPLDTHIHDVALNLGLTDRKTTNLKTAKEITESLKELDSSDPVKYDFALCHLQAEE